jgi:hypothetical protein
MRTRRRVSANGSEEEATPVSLPQLTALQFLVLAALVAKGEVSGRDLRAWLSQNGVRSSGPQFYQLMARMEDSQYVEGWYHPKEIEHQVVNERRYRILDRGRAAWNATGDFYFSIRNVATGSKRSRRPSSLQSTT